MAMRKEQKSRQSGKLRDVHIRIPERTYQQIVKICDKLDITQAQYFNEVIHQDGYDKLIDLAKRIIRQPVPYTLEMSDECRESIDKLTEELAYANRLMRNVGSNVSAYIRDRRKVCSDSISSLEEIYHEIEKMQKEYHNIGLALLFNLLASSEKPEVKKKAQKNTDYSEDWVNDLLNEAVDEEW